MIKLQLILQSILVIQVFAYFEIVIERKSDEPHIDLSDKVTGVPQAICPFSNINTNDSEYTPQLCFSKDITYNFKVLLGTPFEKNNEVIDMAVDLTIPQSWIKQRECKQCPQNSQMPESKQDIENLNCFTDQCSGKKLLVTPGQFKEAGKKASILGEDHLISGQYIYEQLNFLAYDPDMNQNILKLIENEIEPLKRLENHEEVIKIKRQKILSVDKLMGRHYYPSDGSIGLGFYEDDSQQDINFLRNLVQSQKDEIMSQNMFSIFINEKGANVKEHVLTFGGANPKFAFQEDLANVRYISVLKETAYYWALNLKKIKLDFKEFDFNPIVQEKNVNAIYFDKISPAIITLSSSFISLPKEQLESLLHIFNSYGNTNCELVDKDEYAVYCKAFSIKHEYSMELEMTFVENTINEKNEQVEVTHSVIINSRNIIRKCNSDAEVAHAQDRYDCLLNLKLSRDNKTILGEPFLKQHYTIFDQENKRIGLVAANDDQFWGLQNSLQINLPHLGGVFKYLAYFLMFILFAILFFLCCIGPFKHGLRSIKQTSLKLKHEASFKEVQSLTQSHNEEENPYAEVEAAMREQAMQEIQKMEEKMEQDEKKLQMNNDQEDPNSSFASFDIQRNNENVENLK